MQAVQTFSNINWKGIGKVIDTIKPWFLKFEWGKIIPAIVVGVLLLLAVWDWRKAHTDLVEAEAQVAALSLERAALQKQVDADKVARDTRAAILLELAAANTRQLDEVVAAVEAAGPAASQPLPPGLRDALRGR